jgi:hypothetical protein
MKAPTLGSKLQRLALVAPHYLNIIESLVDLFLRRSQPNKRKTNL